MNLLRSKSQFFQRHFGSGSDLKNLHFKQKNAIDFPPKINLKTRKKTWKFFFNFSQTSQNRRPVHEKIPKNPNFFEIFRKKFLKTKNFQNFKNFRILEIGLKRRKICQFVEKY